MQALKWAWASRAGLHTLAMKTSDGTLGHVRVASLLHMREMTFFFLDVASA